MTAEFVGSTESRPAKSRMMRALRESIEKIDHPVREVSNVDREVITETGERDLL